MALTTQVIITSLFGVSTHLLYFRKEEHHLYSLLYVKVLLASLGAIAALSGHFADGDGVDQGWGQALLRSAALHCFYLGGVYTSLLAYRLLFHPLRKFPGPLDLRVSALSLSWRVRRYDTNKRVQDWHAKYGPFVRISPSAVSVVHPAAVKLIHSSDSDFSKGEFYDLMLPYTSLHTLRDKTAHAARRRVWSAAFGDKALRDYGKRTQVYQNKLLSKLAAARGAPVDITRWFHSYSTDVSSDLSFGKLFGSLDSEENHWFIDIMYESPLVVGLMLPMWFFRLLCEIPGMNREFLRYLEFHRDCMIARIKVLTLPFFCNHLPSEC